MAMDLRVGSFSRDCPRLLRLHLTIMAFVLYVSWQVRFVGGVSLPVPSSLFAHRSPGRHHPSSSLSQQWQEQRRFSIDRFSLAPQIAPLPSAPTPGFSSVFRAPDSAPRPSPNSKPRSKGFPHLAAPPTGANRNEKGKAAGIALIAVAGLLQVVVVSFLLAKRRQMLKVVRTYEYDSTTDNCNGASST